MTAAVEIRPGLTPLADWRAIYRGATVTLDPVARADVEAGKAALSAILSRNGLLPPQDIAGASPSIAELVEKRGEPLPSGLLRLFVALKLGSLAQGMSGVRWSVIKALAEFLSHDLLPVVTAEDVNDRIALSRLFGALTGTGEVLRRGRVRPAQKALKKADLNPLTLNPRERSALLSGTQLSLAAALAGLFEAERVLQSAIVAAALSAAGRLDMPLHPSVHRLQRQRGQREVAATFRQLLGRGEMEAAPATAANGAEEHAGRSLPLKMGACLDLLRQAGATLERAANGVTEDRLVLWQSEEIVAGVADLSSVALSADLIALALRTIGDLAETRIAATAGQVEASGPGDNEGTSGLKARAAVFVAENRERARPTALDPSGVWRLLPMAGTTALVIAIEFLEATRGAETSPNDIAAGLDSVRRSVREVARPANETGAVAAGNLASVAVLVGSGTLAAAAGVTLPSLTPPPAERQPSRLVGHAKRT